MSGKLLPRNAAATAAEAIALTALTAWRPCRSVAKKMPRGRVDCRKESNAVTKVLDVKMHPRRLLSVCALPMALVLLAGLARAQAPQQDPQDTASEPALELPTGELLDLSTPEPDEIKGAKPLVDRPPAAAVDSKVGIDYRKPSIPATTFQPDQLTAGAVPDQSTGVAWATVTAPGWASTLGLDQTAIETRVDPSQEQGQLGTKLSRSVPVGEDVSLTLENGVSMTRGLAPGTAQSHGWATSQALRFNVLPTDTTLSVGADMSSTDDKWLRTLSAEQKLFGGPFSVTGSVSETASGEMSKSLRAGFKRTW
jgi:hypothetical protein